MSFFIESHEPVNNIRLFFRNTFSLPRWLLFYIWKFSNSQFLNMLPLCENKSYCWLVIYIYIQDFMTNHPHLLVFIKSFTKNFMFLGLTSVDFYHPYTDLLFSDHQSFFLNNSLSNIIVEINVSGTGRQFFELRFREEFNWLFNALELDCLWIHFLDNFRIRFWRMRDII